jgi:hypothetical protein
MSTRIIKINTVLSQNTWFLWTYESRNEDKHNLSWEKKAQNTHYGISWRKEILLHLSVV